MRAVQPGAAADGGVADTGGRAASGHDDRRRSSTGGDMGFGGCDGNGSVCDAKADVGLFHPTPMAAVSRAISATTERLCGYVVRATELAKAASKNRAAPKVWQADVTMRQRR